MTCVNVKKTFENVKDFESLARINLKLSIHFLFYCCRMEAQDLKSVNLQYVTLVRSADWTNNSSTKCDVPSIIFFHKILQNSLHRPFHFFYKITKMKTKSFECHKSIRNYEKKILGTSDTWSTTCLCHRPSEPAYHIVDCRIFRERPPRKTSKGN